MDRYVLVSVDDNLAGGPAHFLIVDLENTAGVKAIAKVETAAVAGPILTALNAS